MRRTTLFLIIALLATTIAAQTADVTVVNGLPGLSGPVDLAVDGSPTLMGIPYGTTQPTTLAAGTYSLDILDAGTVVVSTALTVAAGDNVSIVAHLLDDGTPTLSIFVNDLSTVMHFGDGRIVVRHVADIGAFQLRIQASTFNFGPHLGANATLVNGQESSRDRIADSYDLTLTRQSMPATGPGWGGSGWGGSGWGGSGWGGSGGGPSFGGFGGFGGGFLPTIILGPETHVVSADQATIVYVIGIENDASFQTVEQIVSLTPAVAPTAPDLSVTGTLVGGSWSAGGDITFGLTGVGSGAHVSVFGSTSNMPQTGMGGWNLGLGIGGTAPVFPVAFGFADATGVFTRTYTLPANSMFTLSSPMTVYYQALTFSSGFWGGSNQFLLSDIESATFNP